MALPDRFCLNHPSTPAAANCAQCHKPVCDECVVMGGEVAFCSNECIEKYRVFKARYRPQPEDRGSWLLTLAKLAAVAVIVMVSLYVGRRLGFGWCARALEFFGL
jgi:hypothetical protein